MLSSFQIEGALGGHRIVRSRGPHYVSIIIVELFFAPAPRASASPRTGRGQPRMVPIGGQTTSPRSWLSRMPAKGQSIVASSAAVGWDGVHGVILEGQHRGVLRLLRAVPGRPVRAQGRGEARLEACEPLFASRRQARRRADRAARRRQPPAHQPGDRAPVLLDRPGTARRDRGRGVGGGRAPFEITESFNRNDGDLWNLGRRLADQIQSPVPGSRLYAETLQTQIAIHLLRDYSSLPRPGEIGRRNWRTIDSSRSSSTSSRTSATTSRWTRWRGSPG